MKKLLLNLYFWPAFILTTVIGLILLPIMLLLNALFWRKSTGKILRLCFHLYGIVLVRFIPFMAPVQAEGNVTTIPRPCILTANHSSAIDPYLYGAITIEICFITSWPFRIPIYGPLMKIAGYINTNDGWETIRQQATAMLEQGASITIWPEGHRSRDGHLRRFRKGAFQLAVETGFPIQPVCIIGSADIMSPGERLLSPGRVKLVFLDPLFPEKNSESAEAAEASVMELRRKTFEAIQNCLDKHRNTHEITSSNSSSNDSHLHSDSLNQPPHDVC